MPRVEVPEYKTFVDFPDGTPPEQMQAVLAQNFPKKHGIIDAFKGAGASVAAGVNDANAAFLEMLDKGAQKISDLTGFRSGGGFKAGAESARESAARLRQTAAESGMDPNSIPAKVYSGVGAAPMGVAEFSAGVPLAAFRGAVENGPTGAVKSGLERFAVGKVFKGLEKANLTPVQRSGAMAGTMAAQTAAEGGSLQDVVASGLTGLALSAPGESGPRNVVRQRLQAEGVQPEVAADLASRGAAEATPQGMGSIDTTAMDRAAPGPELVRPMTLDAENAPRAEVVRPATPAPVLDSENAPRISPYDAVGAAPGLSIEVARLKQEHPFWSDAELLTEAQRTVLTHNPEVLPAATDSAVVRPTDPQPIRQSEDAPGMRRGLPVTDSEAQRPLDRFNTVDRITEPPQHTPVLNPEVLPARTERDIYAPPAAPPERPAENAPSRTVESQSMENFNHDSLPTAAVTAADSLALQQQAPQVKVAVVGTPAEIKQLSEQGQTRGKVVFQNGDRAYVIDPVEAIKQFGSIDNAKRMLRTGGDAEAQVLGYPPREGVTEPQTAAVTRQGEVLTDPAQIKQAASEGAVTYAAEGKPEDVATATQRVSDAIAPAGQEGGGPSGQEGRGQEVLTEPGGGPIQLHAGLHLPTLIQQGRDLFDHYFRKLDPTAAPGSVKEFLDQNRKANQDFGAEPLTARLRRAIVDSSANVQNKLMSMGSQGEWVRRQFDAISGASTKAQMEVEKQREALSGMSLREQQAMGDLIAIDRDLAIHQSGRQGYTFIGGKTPAELAAARQSFAADYKLTPEEFQRVEQASRQYFDAWKRNTQRMLDSGLITPDQKTALDSHDYSPKQFLEKIDPDTQQFSPAGNRITVPDSGIQRLKQGSDGYFRNNPMRLLSEATARVETRIARNEANQALAALPAGNGIAEVAPPGSKPPAGYESISYMENGQQKTIHMRTEYAKEWIQNDPLINSQLVNALQWLTGAKAVRALATGYNPAFAVTNIPRDLVTIFMQADKRGYSPHAPVALAEMLSDMTAVARDAWTRSGRLKDYVAQGGGRELLTHEGALTNRRENLSPVLAKVQKTLSYINETSELLTRLAYRERLIKNGVDPTTASRMAAEYVDFSRGGTVAKAVDRMGIPYLNAALQGTRSLARSAGRDPAAFAYKTAQLMVGAAGLYALNQATNPEGWANVSDREKAGNFIIMLPKQFNYTDKDGTDTAMYLKVSKEQSMRPFASVAELFTAWANGEKPTGQQVQMALTDALPISIDKMPPVAAAFWTYALNADTYKKEPVWKGKQEVEPYAEYTQTTNPIYRDAGRFLTSTDAQGIERGGLSPERMKAAVEKIITPSNFYAQMAGNAITNAYEKANPQERADYQKTTQEQLRSIPGISRLLGGAKDTEQFREGIREARTGTATQQFETNKAFDAMVMRYVKGGQQDPALYQRIVDYINKQPPAVQDRLNERSADLADTANLPDRGWWLSVKSLQPEDRADQFKARLKKSDPSEQKRLIELANNLPGFISDRFMERYDATP